MPRRMTEQPPDGQPHAAEQTIRGNPVLTADSLSKRYSRGNEATRRRGLTALWREISGTSQRDGSLRATEFWALRGVTLNVHAGEALGVMGLNGAGKSTLLRLLTGLSKPDDGHVHIRGRVAALLDPTGGFDPLLTGRENIIGSPVLWDVDGEHLDEVASHVMGFAELGSFIDAPVRTYSKGMRMRLAFSIVANAASDIVIIDEALAVGDLAFQRRCVEFLRRFVADGGALILVSHSIWALEALCERGLLLESGRATASGPITSVTDRYAKVLLHREAHEGMPLPIDKGAVEASPSMKRVRDAGQSTDPGHHDRVSADYSSTSGSGTVDVGAGVTEELSALDAPMTGHPPGEELMGPTNGRTVGFTGLELCDEAGGPPVSLGSMRIRISYRADHSASPVGWGLVLYSADGQLAAAGAWLTEGSQCSIEEGAGTLEVVVPDLPLSSGKYTARIAVVDGTTQVPLGLHGFDTPATPFEVIGPPAGVTLDGLARIQTLLHSTVRQWWVGPAH